MQAIMPALGTVQTYSKTKGTAYIESQSNDVLGILHHCKHNIKLRLESSPRSDRGPLAPLHKNHLKYLSSLKFVLVGNRLQKL